MPETVIKAENLSKKHRLGVLGVLNEKHKILADIRELLFSIFYMEKCLHLQN